MVVMALLVLVFLVIRRMVVIGSIFGLLLALLFTFLFILLFVFVLLPLFDVFASDRLID